MILYIKSATNFFYLFTSSWTRSKQERDSQYCEVKKNSSSKKAELEEGFISKVIQEKQTSNSVVVLSR